MEEAQNAVVGFTEEFRYKAENAVAEHIAGVQLAAVRSKPRAPAQDKQHNDIEGKFKLPCRPERALRAGDRAAIAAARDKTVHPGTHEREKHTDNEDIEYIAKPALK